MTTLIKDGQIHLTEDLRTILNSSAREFILQHVAPKLGMRLVRSPQGLAVCLQDNQSGTLLSVTPLHSILQGSLEEGTLVENSLDGLPKGEALKQVGEAFQELAAQSLGQSAATDTPEEDFWDEEMEPRDPAVDLAQERELQAVG